MSLAIDLAFQLVQMTLVIALAPLLTGLVRKVKARLTRKRGASIFQPYFDLYRLARKEAIVAESASPLFRVFPYIIFAATWVAAALVPTFATGLCSRGRPTSSPSSRCSAPGASSSRSPAWTSGLLRRPRLEPRGDVRNARRARDAGDRVLAGADRGLDPALDGRRLHGVLGGRPARDAGHGARRARHGRAGGERPHSRSTIPRPTSS